MNHTLHPPPDPEHGDTAKVIVLPSHSGQHDPPQQLTAKRDEQGLDFFVREEALFKQSVQLDLEHEKLVMYRMGVALGWVVLMVMCRQWVMAAL